MNFAIAGFHVSGPALVLGFATGMIYGLLGVGLVLIHRSSRIINFAYGDIGALGAAVLAVAVRSWGLPYWVAMVVALATGAAASAASELLVIRRLRAAPLVLSIIATIGLGQVFQLMALVVGSSSSNGGFGLSTQGSFPQPTGFPQFSVGALLMTPAYTAMVFLTPFVVAILTVFYRRGRTGLAMRASAANPDAARMAGMLAGRMSSVAWAIAGALAAFTAILVLPTRGYAGGQFLGYDLLLRALTCAVLARMVSLPLTLISGIIIGVVEQTLLVNYPNGGLVSMVLFITIMVGLLVQRPATGRSENKNAWALVQGLRPLPASYREVGVIRNLGWWIAAIGGALALIVPELASNATAGTFTVIVAFGVVGLSVALVTGLGGQLSLGQFAIAAVGASAAYRAVDAGAPFVVGLIVAAVASALVSLVIGLPALRLKGLMIAVATLGFALAADDWLLEQPWMFGHGVISHRPAIGHFTFDNAKRYYLVAFAVLLFALWLVRNVWTGGFGRRLRAVRDNEDAARAFSVPSTTVKLQSFILGGVVAGLGGAVYGSYLAQQGVSAYPVDASISAAAASVIGGLGLLVGPILGAFYIIGLPRFLPLDNVGLAATAAGWLLLLLQFPGGLSQMIAPVRDRIVDRLARRAGLDPAQERRVTPGGGIGVAAEAMMLSQPAPRAVPAGEVLLRSTGLTKRFGGLTAVNGVDLDVRSGEVLGLIGPNGAGKTTLFELLGGFTRPDAGSVMFQGKDITRSKPEDRARLGLIRSFQDAVLFPTMTVHEVVMVALERAQPTRFMRTVAGLGARADGRRAKDAENLLGALGLISYRDSKILELSTGTRRIAELACLIALEPVLLLLDEPSSGIAQRETEALGHVLSDIREQLDMTMVIIEHDIPLLMGLSDRVVAMESGAVIAVGSPAEVQANPRVISSYLGGDVRAIERSARTGRVGPEDSDRDERCAALTRTGVPCQRKAGPGGVCAQHGRVLSRT